RRPFPSLEPIYARSARTLAAVLPVPLGSMSEAMVKIGGAAGFWGDSSVGAPQLAEVPGMRYIVFDYLAELTMSILAAARAKNRDLGYATEVVAREILAKCRERGIRLIANAGGVNPGACARALERLAAELGVSLKVAVV